MTQRTSATTVSASSYEDMPLSIVLFRFMWPFWLFRDASHGDRFARAAAYRHNREMRVYLPGYITKWVLSAGLVLTLSAAIESLIPPPGPTSIVWTLLSALCGIVLTCSLCVLLATAYVYVYLSRNER
jgi:hypothetical protein